MAATLRYVERAVERLAAFVEANLATHLATVETELELAALTLERPSVVLRGFDDADHRDNRIEVYDLQGGAFDTKDRTLFSYEMHVAITLFSDDAQIIPVQIRMRRWQSAWWLLMSNGASSLGGTVNAALCGNFSNAPSRHPRGGHVAVAVVPVTIIQQES